MQSRSVSSIYSLTCCEKKHLPLHRLLIQSDADVRQFAADYFHIRIWGAPFTLMNYVILGWLMGMAKMKEALSLQILINVMNMALAFLLVHVFSFAVKGVAAATLMSELTAFVIGAWIIMKHSSNGFQMPSIKRIHKQCRKCFM
ncbi:MATE family efflux transporter [Bacillus safensis]|uniref:MATE family efflux transporter n=1 Tax=Bacillus safensis TaxID=561879 RepID=UPI0037F66FA6